MTNHFKRYEYNGYFIKVDVKKYFQNIDHKLLKIKLNRLKISNDILALLFCIIDSFNYDANAGLPMGNQTSQCFALLYLNDVDRAVKEFYRVKYYIRYMDDLVMIIDIRDKAKILISEIAKLLEKENLTINCKSQIITIKNGVEFLGWVFKYSKTGQIIQTLKQRSKRRMLSRVGIRIFDYNKGKISQESLKSTVVSYRGHLSNGKCYSFRMKIMEKLKIEN